ncbi:MAG: glucose-1-phosphate adenylyltransferase [Bacteroidia bacterium]
MKGKIKMICLILGGGQGSRLFPLTKSRSKPAVPIGGKYRLIDIPISNCINSGVKRMFVLTQFNSASLNRHIKNTYSFDHFGSGFVDILAAEQTPGSDKWFQGTADAVRQSMHHLAAHDYDYILLLSGDQLYQMDFKDMAEFHIDKDADLTIATIPVDAKDAPDFGIMKTNKQSTIESFIEKPAANILENWQSPVSAAQKKKGKHYLASMGIYIFKKEALQKLFAENPDATDFGKAIIPAAINQGMKVSSFQFDGYWTDIGSIPSFYEANLALCDDLPQFNLFDNQQRVFTRARILAPSKISGTKLNKSIIADGCIIHAKLIDYSVIGIRARIGEKTSIKSSIIMGNDFYQTLEEIVQLKDEIPMGIGKSCVIEKAILDKDCRIGDQVSIIGHPSLKDTDTDQYTIVEGIVVVKKKAVIPSGSVIGYSKTPVKNLKDS